MKNPLLKFGNTFKISNIISIDFGLSVIQVAIAEEYTYIDILGRLICRPRQMDLVYQDDTCFLVIMKETIQNRMILTLRSVKRIEHQKSPITIDKEFYIHNECVSELLKK